MPRNTEPVGELKTNRPARCSVAWFPPGADNSHDVTDAAVFSWPAGPAAIFGRVSRNAADGKWGNGTGRESLRAGRAHQAPRRKLLARETHRSLRMNTLRPAGSGHVLIPLGASQLGAPPDAPNAKAIQWFRSKPIFFESLNVFRFNMLPRMEPIIAEPSRVAWAAAPGARRIAPRAKDGGDCPPRAPKAVAPALIRVNTMSEGPHTDHDATHSIKNQPPAARGRYRRPPHRYRSLRRKDRGTDPWRG